MKCEEVRSVTAEEDRYKQKKKKKRNTTNCEPSRKEKPEKRTTNLKSGTG